MSSQIRVVKKDQNSKLKQPAVSGQAKSERQRNREIVTVVKSWIAELQLRRRLIAAPTTDSSR
jgi:hypothetical protein